eukprot:9485713-Pyramimonas_sp.AAC.1
MTVCDPVCEGGVLLCKAHANLLLRTASMMPVSEAATKFRAEPAAADEADGEPEEQSDPDPVRAAIGPFRYASRRRDPSNDDWVEQARVGGLPPRQNYVENAAS